MSKLVTVFGGSGFVGRYVARRMAHQGWRVRVACRNPDRALFVRTYGVVGQVEPVFCNIRDDDSVRAVMTGSQAAVNCVGILAETGKQSFDALQHEGAERIARIAAAMGVTRFVQISAIGADPDARSAYARTKGWGERAVLKAMPQATILRPSIVFGHEDQFFNRFAGMTRISPFVPVVGASTRFQPVYVDDVAHAAEVALTGQVRPGIFELGGPDIATFRALIRQMLQIIRRRRIVLAVPFWAGTVMGWGFDLLGKISLGLIGGPISLDQVRNLRHDNIVGPDHGTFADLGISPTAMESVLPDYLWRFRPSGQYAAIKESARDLRP